jgi:transcriptional regulator with GAF, ATPase, and Fis domain
VDTFLDAYSSSAPSAIRAGQDARSLVPAPAHAGTEKVSALDEIHAGSTEGVALLEVRRLLSRAKTPTQAINEVAGILRQVTPATVVALFELDSERDVLKCVQAVGDEDALLNGFEIRNSERTTGWAAANQCSIMNSAATLDLGTIAEAFAPPLKSALCAPVRFGDAPIGVLALYSTLEAPFAERHRYMAEQIASFLVERVYRGPRQGAVVSFREQFRLTNFRK